VQFFYQLAACYAFKHKVTVNSHATLTVKELSDNQTATCERRTDSPEMIYRRPLMNRCPNSPELSAQAMGLLQ